MTSSTTHSNILTVLRPTTKNWTPYNPDPPIPITTRWFPIHQFDYRMAYNLMIILPQVTGNTLIYINPIFHHTTDNVYGTILPLHKNHRLSPIADPFSIIPKRLLQIRMHHNHTYTIHYPNQTRHIHGILHTHTTHMNTQHWNLTLLFQNYPIINPSIPIYITDTNSWHSNTNALK